MLLHGPPGTGKSLTAQYVAASLGLPLLVARVDTLVSSYLGSTSKNLRNLFEHASRRPCVLFLDELDALASCEKLLSKLVVDLVKDPEWEDL